MDQESQTPRLKRALRVKGAYKLKNVDFAHLKKLCEAGWSDEQICEFIGIGSSTLYRWKNRYPDLAQKMDDWKLEADRAIERATFQSATGYSVNDEKIFVHIKKTKTTHPDGRIVESEEPEVLRIPTQKHYPPNSTSIIFWLCNRMSHDWKRTRQEQSSDPLSIKILNLISKNGNGNGTGRKSKDNGDSMNDITVQSSATVERGGGLQIVQ